MNAIPAGFAIGRVARKAGLSIHTIRAWERRYGAVQPSRTAGGTRLYSGTDIERLSLLRRATEAGHSIGNVATLALEELKRLVGDESEDRKSRRRASSVGAAGTMVDDLLDAVDAMQGERMHALLMRAVVTLPVREVIEEVILPVLREVGDRWSRGSICPAHEHLLSTSVRRVLAWLTDSVPVEPGAPVAVVTTPSGQWHEMGAQIAGVFAALAGCRVIYLGPNLPSRDIVRAVEVTGGSLVLLGASMPHADLLLDELTKVRRGLPKKVAVFAGGAGVEEIRERLEAAGVEALTDYRELEQVLTPEAAPYPQLAG